MENKNNKSSDKGFKDVFMRNRKTYISVFVCLFAVYALLMIGINVGDNGQQNQKTEIEEENKDEENKGIITGKPVVTPVVPNEADNSKGDGENQKPAGSTEVKVSDEVSSEKTENTQKVTFDVTKGIAWPADGDVIMPYSMEHAVYYETLCQFMTSDGMLIDAVPGTIATACCDSVVSEIYTDTRHGQCVVLTAGDYSFTYGQLKSVSVKKGDSIKEGTAVGMIGEPTKYFEKEGTHLYFKAEYGDSAVDPEELLREKSE